MFAVLSFVIVSLCGISQALRLPVAARSGDRPGVRILQSKLPENVDNARDIVYATNITLGGQEFPIQLDTGSSDVWVQPPFPIDIKNVTEIQTNLTFGIGKVQGNVCFADMSLGPYHVDDQAFLNATDAKDFGAIFSNNIYGILGLAFDQGSDVYVDTVEKFGIGNKQARTFLRNIFAQDTSAPNLFTVLLGRTDDPDGPQEGLFTISEYEPEWKAVADQPKLHRTPPQLKNITALPRWSVVMDKMTVNGQSFQFNQSAVEGLPEGSQITVLDTGFTFSQIPAAAVDFIYSSIEGATYNETSKLWEVPCNATTQLEFTFGNVSYPIHPLDITTVKHVNGQATCYNTFRPITLPPGAGAGFDAILGVSFLKNVYASFDFGDWTPDEDTNGLPFVQMLPTTKPDEAMAEFVAARPMQIFKSNKAAKAAATPPPAPLVDQDFENQFLDTELPDGAASLNLKRGATTTKRHTKRGMMLIVSAHQAQRYNVPADVAKAQGSGAPMEIPKARVAVPIPPFPFPLPPRARPCINAVLASYGPAVVALLAGILFLSLITCVVGILLLFRFLMHTEEADAQAYEPMLIKEDVLVVPRDYTATKYHD